MTLAVWFWIILVLWILGYGYVYKTTEPRVPWFHAGLGLVPLILILILGWTVFGSPVK